MDFDEYRRRQREMDDLLGLGQRASAIGEALKLSRPLSDQFGPGSAIQQAMEASRPLSERIGLGRSPGIDAFLEGGMLSGIALDGGIGTVLREHNAFSASGHNLQEFADVARGGIAVNAIAARYQEQIGAMHDLISRDMLGVGAIGNRLVGVDLASKALSAERAQVGAIARAAHWATGLDERSSGALAGIFTTTHGITDQIKELTRAAAGIVEAGGLGARASRIASGAIDETTALRFATFAGSIDMFGPRSTVGQAALESILGTWRTTADLPASFFRDPSVRARRYRAAEVDPGLINADNGDVIDVLVQTGVVSGERTATGVRALIEVGPLRMSITTRRARHDAFRAIDGFEVALRAFIGVKLAADVASGGEDPDKWFTLRVPGNIVGEAKRIRRHAYRAGEPKQPLVNFTNLGDLISVITSNRNWDAVFGAVFEDRDGIKVDLQRLNAHRRPTMHARPIDGPRLAEILLTIRRLGAMMEADGGWVDGWDDDL